MSTGYLRFAPANVGYVIDGVEDATVRYGFDRDIEEGDTLKLLTQGNNLFGYAIVEDVFQASVNHVAYDVLKVDKREHPATDTMDLLDRLQKHYPDEEIGIDSEVTVIYFDLTQVGQVKA